MDLLYANDQQGEYPASYYAADAKPLPRQPKAHGQIQTQVCVIGAGFTGLSAALHLAWAGYDVTLIEAQRIGFGASGRNGGQVGTGQRLEQDALEAMIGRSDARALWGIAQDAVQLVKDLVSQIPDCNFRPGIIHAMHRPRHVRVDHAYVQKLNQDYGYSDIRCLSCDEMRAMVGSEAYFGGSLDQGAGHIQPLRYAIGLAQMALAAGVKIFEESAALSIERGAQVRISTDDAQITADHLILGCNGYLGDLEGQVAERLMPINNFIVATERLDSVQRAALIAYDYAVADSKFVVNYFRFSEDGRMVFGGSESYGYRFPKDIASKVRKPMLQIFPQLAEARIDYAWGGTLGITMNRMPSFAYVDENIFSASGYSGHGVAMASMGGKLAAEAVMGRKEGFDLMASVPTPRFPGGRHMRTPLLVLAMLWYGMRDRI
ncbi:gamma-glutamylputrescine oxidase [Amylibacter marinus]|uniref:Gamma-glutamylputrescine oxidase n=1 Tax=Amylibacter marinus TaxID=1475483 RepID=A0ABQ5VVU6_9RHOB|nr:FAD-binding oxidoreductase [Amylibacter marinus]GLQ35460.1 gamma-glutamylputrescine oxidase [Amylibacter marinus]